MEELMECFRLEGPGGNDTVLVIVWLRVGQKSVSLFLFDDHYSATVYLSRLCIHAISMCLGGSHRIN